LVIPYCDIDNIKKCIKEADVRKIVGINEIF